MDLLEISRKLVERSISEGFSEAIALVSRLNSTMAKIFESQLSVIQRWDTLKVSLYLARDKRVFVLELEPSSLEQVDRSVKELMSIADRVQESQLYAPIPAIDRVEPMNVVDRSVVEYMDRVSDIVERLIEVSHREKIDSVAGTVHLNYQEKAFSSSTSAQAIQRKAWVSGYIRAFSGDGSGQWSYTSTRVDLDNLEKIASTASRLAVESRGRVDIEPGVYDVILSPMVLGNLVNYIAEMASAFSVLSGVSIFMGKNIGDTVASDRLNIYDVPRDTELPGVTGFDEEGVQTFNKPIVENGVLKNLLHNTKTAKAMGANTTGNAGWLSPRPWNIMVAPGDATFDEMVSEVKRGLIITNNWYTRLQNYITGEFSTIARDAIFLIENGRITKALNKVRIADTFYNIMKNIDMVGRDLYNVQWWEVEIPTRAPYVLIRNIRISKHIV